MKSFRRQLSSTSSDGDVICLSTSSEPDVIMRQAFTPDEDGDLPLHLAVIHNRMDVIMWALEVMVTAAVNIDSTNRMNQTALHLAVLVDSDDILQLLLRAGASVCVRDGRGRNALHLAVLNSSTHALRIILTEAAQDAVQQALNATDYEGFLPLHVASRNKQHDAIIALVDAGANVNAQDATSGRTALFHAAEANDVATCRVLLGRGADPNVANFASEMAVYAASGRKHNQVVALLVQHGADTCMPSSSIYIGH